MASEEFERGTRFGKYEIHGRLSVGGMAELYLASLAGAGGFRKFVALKRVLPSVAQDESFIQMFLDEARITATLSHTSIAQVFELTEDPSTHEPVLVMEFVAGQNLEQLLSRARKRQLELPVEFTCRVAHDLLMGLHYAHGFVEPSTGTPMPVIHRDINPRNVMVTYTGGTKIIDFGIAKARGRLNQTQVGFVKGTIQYMAPEQVTAKEITGRTDLFAASVLLYELFSGRRLFGDEGSDAATMSRIVSGDVPHLARAAPKVPEALADAVMRGLERDPARRWRNGREYARAIDGAMPGAWDDQQMGELMARLFEDKIAITRGLLNSASAEPSTQELRLMTMKGEEDRAAEKKEAFDDARTTPARSRTTDRTEEALGPVATVASARPGKTPGRTAAPTAADLGSAGASTAADLRKVEPSTAADLGKGVEDMLAIEDEPTREVRRGPPREPVASRPAAPHGEGAPPAPSASGPGRPDSPVVPAVPRKRAQSDRPLPAVPRAPTTIEEPEPEGWPFGDGAAPQPEPKSGTALVIAVVALALLLLAGVAYLFVNDRPWAPAPVPAPGATPPAPAPGAAPAPAPVEPP